MFNMDELFKNKAINIRIYMGTETQTDPYEKTVDVTLLNPIPIKAIVTDLTSTQMSWKSAGIIIEKAKEIIIKKKYKNLLEMSQKIEIDGEFYEGWRTNGKLNYRQEASYIRAYIYIKKS